MLILLYIHTTNIAMKSLLQINGLLLRNERIIVPTTMHQEMRTKIHAGHLGIEKSRAREVLFWPGMSTKITDMIGNCSICLEYRNKQQKEHL